MKLFSTFDAYIAIYGEAQPLVEANRIMHKLIKRLESTSYGKKQVGWVIKNIVSNSKDNIKVILSTPRTSEGYVLYKDCNGGLSTHTFGGRFNNDVLACRYSRIQIGWDNGWELFIQLSRYTKKGEYQKYVVHSSGGNDYEV